MKLFSLDKSYNVVWEPQTLLIKPFNAIFKRDKSVGKTKANKELAFVYFYCDIKSDYNIHVDLEIKESAIKADLLLSKTWKKDKVILEAIEYYKNMSKSITANILEDSTYIARKLSSKMKEAVNTEDLDIIDIGKLLDGIKKMPDVIKSLQDAEKAVLKEIEEGQGKLGSKQKAMFEDGL